MDINVIRFIMDYTQKNNYTNAEQKKCLEFAKYVIKIQHDIMKRGINIVDKYCNRDKFPVLSRGLLLIKQGIEPSDIERILVNTIIVNKYDYLSSIIILEGIAAIQMNQNPYLTKEIIKSYFSIEFESVFEEEINSMGLELNIMQVLDSDYINKLLDDNKD